MNNNPLFDKEFLIQLDSQQQREVFARITALTNDELPIEYIEGKVTGGSINVDGSSAVRRTCSLSMVAQDININDFYWGFRNKFKLEIGLKNTINPIYPEIIWFKMGMYVITSFSTSQSTNNYNISISGKDKMCLLNGDLAGSLPHQTDFGIEEEVQADGSIKYTPIPIVRIIREMIQNFGNELAHNIVINDVEENGFDLLEYRGDREMYLLRDDTGIFVNMTLNGGQRCYHNGEETILSEIENYDSLSDLLEKDPTKITLTNKSEATVYTVAKMPYGSIVGYRQTDLVYAGDLIANVGEAITSILDKIKNMLGDFEYFYDLDGRFIFQKKPYYISTPWGGAEEQNELVEDTASGLGNDEYSFTNGVLISSFNNNPNIMNVRNDFSVWGTLKTSYGSELPIHMRYAIDKKPEIYCSFRHLLGKDNEWTKGESIKYSIEEYDWRELIYQMALDYRRCYHNDDFIYYLKQYNPQYYTGKTGYEQYYVDMEGFWRLLYNKNPEVKYEGASCDQVSPENAYVKNAYVKCDFSQDDINEVDLENLYVLKNNKLIPFIDGYCHLNSNFTYYYVDNSTGKLNQGTSEEQRLNNINIRNLYEDFNNTITVSNDNIIFITEDGYVFLFLDDEANPLYKKEDKIKIIWKQFLDSYQNGLVFYKKLKDNSYTKCNAGDLLYYKDNEFQKDIHLYIRENNFSNDPTIIINEAILYYYSYTGYNEDGWSEQITNSPETLLFWFDFLDAETSELGKYSVPIVGLRSKSIKDDNVKTIYYREIPNVIFGSEQQFAGMDFEPGYVRIYLQGTMENLFTISTKGISAKEKIDELLYQHGCCVDSVTINSLPVYYLEPNTKIYVRDDKSGIDGKYVINRISIPLTYNGQMSINATKMYSNIT